jgi:hypothetical protein
MTQPPVDDDFQDRIQRILNDKKKEELRDKYGMQLEGHSENLSPQAEGGWLDYVTEFERQFENAGRISVRERIGNPAVRPLTDIPAAEIESELDHLLELLHQNNIVIDFLHDIEDREAYRFITEELLDETMDDLRIPDMYSHFIYEDFHPNDEDDVTLWTEEFMYGLFKQEQDTLQAVLAKENLQDTQGNPISLEQFKKRLAGFYEEFPVITNYSARIRNMTIDNDEATVEIDTLWHAIPKDGIAVVKNEGVSKLKLARSPYDGWDVIRVEIAGWNF